MRIPGKHDLSEKDLTERIIGFAINVHRMLGPGLLESVYEECFCHELATAAVPFMRQQPIPVVYNTVNWNADFGPTLSWTSAFSSRLSQLIDSRPFTRRKS